jgi:hypothetical protein
MAQYLISVLADPTTLASTEEEAAIDVFNERLRTGGHWVFAGGLASPGTATVIDGRSGDAVFTDGPAVPAGARRGVAGGLRPGHHSDRQHRRGGLLGPPPRPDPRRTLVTLAGIPNFWGAGKNGNSASGPLSAT